MQTLVLAASFASFRGAGGEEREGRWGVLGELLSPAFPAPSRLVVGARGEAVMAAARLLLVPAASAAALWVLRRGGLLQGLPPLALLVALVQAAMPTAQNLVLLLNLQADGDGRPAGAAFAAALVRQYAASVVPTTLWLSLFAATFGLRTQPQQQLVAGLLAL